MKYSLMPIWKSARHATRRASKTKARTGEIPEFTGVSAPYQAPLNAEVTLDTNETPVGDCVSRLAAYIGRALTHNLTRIDDVG